MMPSMPKRPVLSKHLAYAIVLGACLALFACVGPSDAQVKADFAKVYPGYHVTELFTGEGDSGNVYKHIRFTRPGDNAVCEVQWGYQQAESGWRLFYRSETQGVWPACGSKTSSSSEHDAAEHGVEADEAWHDWSFAA